MPDWLRDPKWLFMIVLVILTTSSLYNSYKLYQLTDGKPPVAKITAIRRDTRSAASAGSRSAAPSAKRYSKTTLRPSL